MKRLLLHEKLFSNISKFTFIPPYWDHTTVDEALQVTELHESFIIIDDKIIINIYLYFVCNNIFNIHDLSELQYLV